MKNERKERVKRLMVHDFGEKKGIKVCYVSYLISILYYIVKFHENSPWNFNSILHLLSNLHTHVLSFSPKLTTRSIGAYLQVCPLFNNDKYIRL